VDTTISRHRETGGAFFRFTWAFLLLAFISAGLAVMFATVLPRHQQVSGYIAAAVCGVIAVALLITAFVVYGGLIKEVSLYFDRIEWKEGGRKVSVAWEDVRQVYRAEIYLNNTLNRRDVTIHAGRHKATFTYILSNWKALAEHIQEYTHPHLWAEAVADFNAGNKVRFGKDVAVSRDGLTVEGKSSRWEDVREVMVRNGNLVVRVGRGDYRASSLADIPNYHVLLSLLEHCPVRPG
jgi:hypothetical protein